MLYLFVIFENLIPQDIYLHLLNFCVAMNILSSKRYSNHLDKAQELLKTHVSQGMGIYGIGYATANVHSALHLVEDYLEFGPTDESAAWRFEDYLGKINRMVRSGNNPVQQIVSKIALKQEKKIKLPPVSKTSLNLNFPNNVYILNDPPRHFGADGPVPIMIMAECGEKEFAVKLFLQTADIFTVPLPSRSIQKYLITGGGIDKLFSAADLNGHGLQRAIYIEYEGHISIHGLNHETNVEA